MPNGSVHAGLIIYVDNECNLRCRFFRCASRLRRFLALAQLLNIHMRATEIISEAPLADYQPIGNFDRQGPFRAVDRRLVTHPVNQLKTAQFLEATPYDFRLFFSNIPGTGRYAETGPVSNQQLVKMFGEQYAGQIAHNSSDAITVVFVGNTAGERVMMTPWIMAHRFGHAVQAGARGGNWSVWQTAERHFFTTVNQILEVFNKHGRGRAHEQHGNLTAEYRALFNALGTQRSSRTGQIRRPYEFMYEMLAQYLKHGAITFNPVPQRMDYGRRAWGNPTQSMQTSSNDLQELRNMADVLSRDMELMFDDVLSSCVGQIYVM